MSTERRVGQEVWIREAVQCVATPLQYAVLQGKDERFYPVSFVGFGRNASFELVVLDGNVVSFENYAGALSFCRSKSH